MPAAYSAVPAFSTTISRGVPSTPCSASSTISFDSLASVDLEAAVRLHVQAEILRMDLVLA